MNVIQTDLRGVLIVEPIFHGDSRGFFVETYQKERYLQNGIEVDFVQDNLSYSKRGILRGLHYQYPQAQDKLVQVLEGEILDVAVDIRKGSPTFGHAVTVHLSSDNKRQLFVPKGFAHGFCVLSEMALFSYKCSDFYNPKTEGGILWSDPDLKIDWPIPRPQLSEKDRSYPRLKAIEEHRLPQYGD